MNKIDFIRNAAKDEAIKTAVMRLDALTRSVYRSVLMMQESALESVWCWKKLKAVWHDCPCHHQRQACYCERHRGRAGNSPHQIGATTALLRTIGVASNNHDIKTLCKHGAGQVNELANDLDVLSEQVADNGVLGEKWLLGAAPDRDRDVRAWHGADQMPLPAFFDADELTGWTASRTKRT